MKNMTVGFMLLCLGLLAAPQEAQAWEAQGTISRCLFHNAVRVCYEAWTTVFPQEDPKNGHVESCDIKDTDDETFISFPGLEAKGNAVYGPNYVDLAPGHSFPVGKPFGCASTAQTARYEGNTNVCVSGTTTGYWTHVSLHDVRWSTEAQQWRHDNIHTSRVSFLPWPISACICGDGGIGGIGGGGGVLP